MAKNLITRQQYKNIKKMDHDKEQIDLDKLKSRIMDLKGIGPVKAEQIVEVIKNETDRCR